LNEQCKAIPTQPVHSAKQHIPKRCSLNKRPLKRQGQPQPQTIRKVELVLSPQIFQLSDVPF